MQQTPNMSLTKWNLVGDEFNHGQLATNWDLVDDHDHTPGKGKQVGAGGIANLAIGTAQLAANAVTTTKINDFAVTTGKIANDAVTSAQIAPGTLGATSLADGSVTDAKLASPNNSAYKTIEHATGVITGGSFVDTVKVLRSSGAAGVDGPTFRSHSLSLDSPVELLYLVAADYLVAGLTRRLRLRANVARNGTSPGMTMTFGLYPVTASAGAADLLSYTVNTTVVPGSIISFLSATGVAQANSGDFVLPSDGYYAWGVSFAGTLTTNARVGVNLFLQQRNTP